MTTGKKLKIFLWCWRRSRSLVYQEKREKKGFGENEKGKNFGGKIRFRVYNVEKMEEDGEKGQICPKEIL